HSERRDRTYDRELIRLCAPELFRAPSSAFHNPNSLPNREARPCHRCGTVGLRFFPEDDPCVRLTANRPCWIASDPVMGIPRASAYPRELDRRSLISSRRFEERRIYDGQ